MADLEVLQDAAVLIDGERIAWVGPRSEARDLHSAFRIPQSAIDVVEVSGVLFPGFVDCHTHAVFGAPRLDDHERRALGEDYKTVAARGGGILQSVRDVRARTESDLVALLRTRVRTLLAHGSTTIEVKSGYGLDPANELKQLRAIRDTAATERAALVPTFLGAHEVPPEFRDRRPAYVRLVCDEMIPAVAREHLAAACDVFCEPGVCAGAAPRGRGSGSRARDRFQPGIVADGRALTGDGTRRLAAGVALRRGRERGHSQRGGGARPRDGSGADCTGISRGPRVVGRVRLARSRILDGGATRNRRLDRRFRLSASDGARIFRAPCQSLRS